LYSQKKLIFFLSCYEKSKSNKTRVNKQKSMNCYIGLAKRLIKSCFPPVIPVPQLEPLDARLIIKQEVKNISTTKECFALSDAQEFKPISDEEAWTATLAWAEVKAREREAALVKAVSQTDTDESYDSDDSNDVFGPPSVAMAGLMRVGEVVRANVYSLNDAAAAAAMWRDDAQADADEFVAAAKAVKKFWANVDAANAAKSQAATIIQAAERGRVVRMVMVIVAEATNVLHLSKFVAVDWEGIAVARAVLAMGVAGLMNTRAVGLVKAVVECDAATIIQAAARGRAVRAWNPFVSVPMASQTDTNELAFVTRFVAREAVAMVARLFGRKISAATLNTEATELEAKARARRVVGPVMAVVKEVAATIIQAAARGRAVRAWNTIFTDRLAHELVHIYRSRYLMSYMNEMTALEKLGAERWDASPKCVRAWIKLAERRRYGNHFWHIHHKH